MATYQELADLVNKVYDHTHVPEHLKPVFTALLTKIEENENAVNAAVSGKLRSGSGAPSNSLGLNDDHYIDTVTGNLYKKAAGTYSIVVDLIA